MQFDRSRWDCPACNHTTFAKFGKKEVLCSRCNNLMTVEAGIFVIAMQVPPDADEVKSDSPKSEG